MKNLSSTYYFVKLVLAVILILVAFEVSIGQDYKYKNFTIEDGLPTNYVYGIIEDNDGYIWAYTERGICKFDGYDWDCLTQKDGLPTDDVIYAFVDSSGVIYAHTYPNELAIIENDIVVLSQNDSHFINNEYSAICRSDNGYFKYSKDKIEHLDLNYGKIYAYFENNSHLYTVDDKFYKEKDGKIQVLNIKWGKSRYNNAGFYNNYLSFNSENHLTIIKENSFRQEKLIIDESEFSTDALTVFDIFKGSLNIQNRFGFVTLDSELDIIDKYFTKGEIANKDVLRSTRDSYGNIWVGTRSSGLFMIPHRYQECQNLEPQSTYNTAFKKLLKNNEGKVLAIADNSDVFTVEGKAMHQVVKGDGKRLKNVHYDIESGYTYLLRNKSMKIYGDDFRPVDINNKKNKYRYLFHGNPITIILSSEEENSFLVGNEIGFMKSLDSKGDFREYSFYPYSRNFLILGKADLALLYVNKDLSYIMKDGILTDTLDLNDKIINTGLALDDSIFVYGTMSHGIYTYNTKSKKDEKVLDCSTVTKITLQDNKYYISTYEGIYILNREFDILKKFTRFQGLASDEVHDILLDGDKLYAATTAGVSLIENPLKPQENLENSKTLSYSSFYINKQEFPLQNEYVLHGDDNNIEISYSYLDYSSSGNIEYQYRLLPKHQQWETTKERKVSFFDLKAGKYTYEMKAIDVYGNEVSAPHSIKINIKEKFYRSIWFWAFCSLASIGLLFYWMKQKAIEKEFNLRKENRVNKKMAELELSALRSQMNPHFVFNALGAIQYYIQTHKVDEADSFLTKFALLMRKYLDSSKERFISIKEEMALLKLYTDLEKMRFEDLFDVEFEVDDDINQNEVHIPTMLIQPFVENAILHGLPGRTDKLAKLTIKVSSNDEGINVEIEDNGVGRKKSEQPTSVHKRHAMQIINEKIETLRKSAIADVSITIIDGPKDQEFPGTRVLLNIKDYDQDR